MKYKKGQSGNPKGRKSGVANKATMEAREAIAQFVDGNAHRLAGWLDQVARTDPEKAFAMFQSVIEYHVPKLARTESETKSTNEHFHTIRREIVDPKSA